MAQGEGRPRLILVLGGARSGKSSFAQRLAQELGQKVLFVATAEPLDEEMKERIEEHRRRRPKDWRTLEAPFGVGKRISQELRGADVVLIDCLTLLLSNLMGKGGNLEKRIKTELKELLLCIEDSRASFILVSNEVGMGIVPGYKSSRLFRDLQGRVNQLLAERADEVYLMVAGLPLRLK